MVWFAAGVLSAFVSWISVQQRRRLGIFALLLLVLAADDALLRHDAVGPHIGVYEKYFYLVYGLTALAVAHSMLHSERTTTVAFWAGAALLATSAVVDMAFMRLYLIEDGAKLLGALLWSTVPLLAHTAALPEAGSEAPRHHIATIAPEHLEAVSRGPSATTSPREAR